MKRLLLIAIVAMTMVTISHMWSFGYSSETQVTAVRAEPIPDEQNPYRAIIMNASEDELRELEQVLYMEAHIDTWEGRVATLQVILNRVLDPRFPSTLHSVLCQKGQYSTYRKRHKANPGETESDAIEHLCDGGEWYIDTRRVYQDCKPIGKNPIRIGKQYFGY